MVIDKVIAGRLINEYKKFLLAIYQPAPVRPEPRRVIEKLAAARTRFVSNRGLLDEYLRDLEDGTEPIDRQMILAIRSLEFSRWVYLRDLKSYSIFLEVGGEYGYGILGLNDEIKAITGGPGVFLESGVVVLDNQYVCDGLIATAVYLGRNMRNSWNEPYKELKQSGNFKVHPLR
jgi:hypothetical protein